MKLTKQVEEEINLVYDTYWKGLLSADLTTYAKVLDENFKLIGTTESEIFFKSSEAIQFLDATSNQVAGNIELRNRIIKTEPIDSLVLITELSDTYVKINYTWTFYGKVRCSSILEKKMQEWKFIQMHLSFPDSKADDGQTIGLEKVEKENLELREAIKRRTFELENKTRELEIEAALERVRTIAMSMKKRDDMLDVCKNTSLQLFSLGVKDIRNVQTAIFYEERGTYMNYEYYAKHHKTFITETIYTNHEIAKVFAKKMLKGKGEVSITLINGKEKVKEWLAYQKTTNVFIDTFLETATSLNYYWFSLGPVALGISTYCVLSDNELGLFKRFLNVFELAYRRYLDIEQAEAQTREAQINLAVERVRARALAMYKSEEILELVFKLKQEIMGLDVPNVAAATIHLQEKDGNYTMWDLTALEYAEGKLHQPMIVNYKLDEVDPDMFIRRMWENTKPYFLVVQDEKDFKRTLQFLRDHDRKNEADESEAYIKNANIKYSYHPTVPLNNGRMCIDLLEPPSEEIEQILTKMGAAFDLAYTRFEDLKNSEKQTKIAQLNLIQIQEEKQRAEAALLELQVTQKQLIQSEKMASLGELTAGIAHEIQNPLNFVNNFSEVSSELLEEMKAELAIGNQQEAIEIADDIKQNLEKINHHGKRADAIVKGMLQHSRSSSGIKEPTDINKLADEYLRLAYHGLRAKDKSFNATMITNYDETIGNINVIPQEIGRVILNLITNAFYAVNEKKTRAAGELSEANSGIENYEPTVSVSTKKNGDNVEISVKDNGNGIPQNVLDKIFQPFFTTKPTGQGTGLGLSLAYDIVKAHGGELKVITIENEGTEFTIQIPTTT